ncbi:hypothetical protein K3495_g3644 [Podosphaera aphanis]|nr:hypothetical protein K3495_g3644 [Podosphaera aphanis]
MAPAATQQVLLSPAELSYLYTSLSLSPPIRSDGRASFQFRTLIAETGVLPGTNGSARICFADGTEAIVGVKAEVEKSRSSHPSLDDLDENNAARRRDREMEDAEKRGMNEWVDVDVELPGVRDDDSMPVFMAAILKEALLTDVEFTKKLWINSRYHWKLNLDILLLSQPLSYPLPLLSLTSHLALLSTRLPRLKSEGDEDPLFDDDWEASVFLYPRENRRFSRPPITLLVMAVKDNIIFDPSKEELTVAEVVLAISAGEAPKNNGFPHSDSGRDLRLLAVRTIDPPSRLTYPGLPDALNTATGGSSANHEEASTKGENLEGVWQPPRGGAKSKLIAAMIRQVLAAEGVTAEVLDGLEAVELS